ncbi:alpha-L-fucosidase [Kribbella antiqua]|uniref:alpha-L-fucosidase n=1 Tax=Kribbella antiqua TaxID=2512217 RepID=A0A4R2IFK4_9ACTN|nr:alpha-L-fucosidase [Kribbella antiqua]TCO41475.1 alpha-L-fucosidase [Kribbella antiqua]
MTDNLWVEVGPDDSPEELRHKASLVRPAPRQVAWQRQELIAFVHFGPNTFTGLECGTGLDDPAVFNPTSLDCDQWARALVSAEFKGVILTAKHHDGFCLWPSRYLPHTVTASPFQGDVVAELAAASKAHDLAFGVYLSPADLHQAKAGCYGNGSAVVESVIPTLVPGDDRAALVESGELPSFSYAVDDYNRFYLNQLYELLTQYGPISEVWLDGADPTGTAQTYDYDAWFDLVRRLAPEATIAVGGPDVRWVGNESGYARYSEWSVVPFTGTPGELRKSLVTSDEAEDLAGPDVLAKADYLKWYPAEVDVSIRPGWFYHPEHDDSVKSVAQLLDMYRNSVGRNAVLLLNIPPDRRGLIAPPDVERLAEFGSTLRSAYGSGDASTFNVVGLQEDITHGQQVEAFAVDALVNESWVQIAAGTTVGHRRFVVLDEPVTSPEVRVRILAARGDAEVSVSRHFDPTVPVARTFESFEAACDKVGVSDDADPGAADLDGAGMSLSAQALAAVGVVPGGVIEHAGFSFRWTARHVAADGQRISLSGSGSRIGILLAGTADRSYGPGLVRYTDGTSAEVPFLALDTLGQGVYPPGAEEVIVMPYYNSSAGRVDRPARVGFCQAALDPSKTLAWITLPRYGDGGPTQPRAHIFGIAIA